MDFNGEMTQHQDSAGQWRHDILVRSKGARNIPEERCREKSTGNPFRQYQGQFPGGFLKVSSNSARSHLTTPSGSSPFPECHLWMPRSVRSGFQCLAKQKQREHVPTSPIKELESHWPQLHLWVLALSFEKCELWVDVNISLDSCGRQDGVCGGIWHGTWVIFTHKHIMQYIMIDRSFWRSQFCSNAICVNPGSPKTKLCPLVVGNPFLESS